MNGIGRERQKADGAFQVAKGLFGIQLVDVVQAEENGMQLGEAQHRHPFHGVAEQVQLGQVRKRAS